MHTFINILLALLMLSVIIIIHEFGHFIMARINGVKVNDFYSFFLCKCLKSEDAHFWGVTCFGAKKKGAQTRR